MTDSTNGKLPCAYIGCKKEGHLSHRIGSSMFCYRLNVCDEHEKELPR